MILKISKSINYKKVDIYYKYNKNNLYLQYHVKYRYLVNNSYY